MSLAPPHLPSPAPTPDGTGPPPLNGTESVEVEQARLRSEVENHLLRLSQDLYEMEICAGEVGKDMEGAVPDYLARINAGFAALHALAGRMTESVPKQVVESIDQYRNPHVYTKNTLSRATGENQYALGRMLGLESFRRQLHSALSQDFPQIPLPERRHQPAHERSSTEDQQRIEEIKVEPEGEKGHLRPSEPLDVSMVEPTEPARPPQPNGAS